MRISQYAYFAVYSNAFSPDQITTRLGLHPTGVSWRGSRSTDPMIPTTNIWRYKAQGTGRIDDLILELVDHFEPVAAELRSLTDGGECSTGINVVRKLDDPNGLEDDAGHDIGGGLVKLPGQHQLLGFHLAIELMHRVVALGCSIDFDEYG
jgi:Domain of unknown function (DUF4279)